MKTWLNGLRDHWHELAVYGFTVPCVFLGGYILNGTHPESGWLPFIAAMVAAGIICLAVDVLQGKTDTPAKVAGKKRNFKLRMLISSLAGVGSGAVIPALVKSAMAAIGIAS